MRLNVLAPRGELDFATVGDFRRQVEEATRDTAELVVVDLSEVSFIDSSGLGAVVEASDRLASAGRRLAVVAPNGSAAALLLDLSGLRRRLAVHTTRQDAVAG